ncbi:TetR/AcrR family transcriptional regulator [Nocardia arthritidis]|uniref:TetR family transcriptional regulator n=1 Tax=Nocardia arthritidis TaxID=228602 RepID=A0A6G9YEL2_9NOCA|nr:TetR/AcrR family transcriptional regulator [Nocardia arthritidis]QIS11669.1 TetR family transcriptional regulator [Nocardia arthritidis]
MTGRYGRPRGDARREQILDVALKTFAENGFRGASLADIATNCGLSQPGLLHHFASKTELLAAVLQRRDEIDARRMEFDGRLSGVAALERLVQLVEYNAHLPGLVRLFTVVTGEAVTIDHPAHEWVVGRYRMLETWLVRALDDGIADGAIRPDTDTAALARQVFAMMDGLQLQWLLDPEQVDMPKLFRAYITQVTSAIAAG